MAVFEAQETTLDLWRAVEAQHRVSTMVLVDTLDEQALLESILDESKPQLSSSQRSMHYLLFTPFRYPPLPNGSRFRGAFDPGVFYGAEAIRTACAELGYWRWRLLNDSPQLQSIPPVPQTLFRTAVAGPAIDLREPPWSARQSEWTNPQHYGACQQLAREARSERVQLIRYQSVRDPLPGACAAVLSHAAFVKPVPDESQTWSLAVFRHRVFWRRDSIFDVESFDFDAARWTRQT
ncbi:MAG TPA: RES family NAD+ phosphorylase [Noviherbaspirillum sp.]|nr:RES family NAD+ phosphorylase [Noviherbaspirillum sp.]